MTDPSAPDLIPPIAAWAEVRRRLARLVDVRTPAEFARAHARKAVNVPLEQLDPAALLATADRPVFFICRGGDRSRQACDRVRQAVPAARVAVVDGGTLAWRDAGLPLVYRRPRRPWTRGKIAAVTAVAVSVLLAIFVHKGLLGIAGLVAAWVVGVVMLHPRRWRQPQPERVTAGSPD